MQMEAEMLEKSRHSLKNIDADGTGVPLQFINIMDCHIENQQAGVFDVAANGDFCFMGLGILINPDVEVKMVENTPNDPRQRKPDIKKAKEFLGWEPKVKLRDCLPLMKENFRLRLGVGKKN
ncbi:hypothetical protein VNO80_03577 [Phaseolus coccineus]|uniref:UDP-glucuronate decarboxylase n=1 Tax=Phaseolus coccineus TaxID=3886 RepID=A0AAN9RIZ5_PHACN